MSETNYCQKNRDIVLKSAKEYYRNNPLTEEQKKRISDYQKEYKKNITNEQKQKEKDYQKKYRKNMSDEQKQRYREARNKCDKDKYHSMTGKQKQKYLEVFLSKII